MRYTHALSVLLIVLAFVAARPAAADPEAPRAPTASGDDDELLDLRRAEPTAPAEEPPRVPLWLSLGASAGAGPNGRELAGMLALGASFDLLARPRLIHAERAKTAPNEEEDAAPSEEGAQQAAPAPRLTGALARGAVRAALVSARTAERGRDLDDLASRARYAGLLPELRLRLAHVLDEDQSLAPTEYDPERVTASGGTSLWIEGRATFRLDRLAFADDEVAIEKLRMDRERAVRATTEEVLRALEKWQRGEVVAADEALPEPERIRAELDAAAASAVLDVLTDGWFSSPAALRLRAPVR